MLMFLYFQKYHQVTWLTCIFVNHRNLQCSSREQRILSVKNVKCAAFDAIRKSYFSKNTFTIFWIVKKIVYNLPLPGYNHVFGISMCINIPCSSKNYIINTKTWFTRMILQILNTLGSQYSLKNKQMEQVLVYCLSFSQFFVLISKSIYPISVNIFLKVNSGLCSPI